MKCVCWWDYISSSEEKLGTKMKVSKWKAKVLEQNNLFYYLKLMTNKPNTNWILKRPYILIKIWNLSIQSNVFKFRDK